MISLQMILDEQFKYHKGFEIQDVYKLIYQATFGCEHIACDDSKKLLFQELRKIKPSSKIRLIENISPKYIFRVNLAAFKYLDLSKENLFKKFYYSSQKKIGSIEDFFSLWEDFKEWNKKRSYFSKSKVNYFTEKLSRCTSREELPIIGHSQNYKTQNNPSYRIILKDYIL